MACDATELLASFSNAENLGWEDVMIVKLALLARLVVAINPSADVSAEALVASGVASGYGSLSPKDMRIAKLSLLCQLSAL